MILRKKATSLIILTGVVAGTFSLSLQVVKATGKKFSPFQSDHTVTSKLFVDAQGAVANHQTGHQTPLPEPEPQPVNALLESSDTADTYAWKNGAAKTYGNATVNNIDVTLASTSSQTAYAYQDLKTNNITGKYVVAIAVADTTITTYTGKPYLYGYLLGGNSVKMYMQSSTMFYDATTGSDVVYGIYQVPAGVDGVRLFWKQSKSYKEQYNGSVVTFQDSGFYVTDTQAEAQAIVDKYQAQLFKK